MVCLFTVIGVHTTHIVFPYNVYRLIDMYGFATMGLVGFDGRALGFYVREY